MPSFEVAPYLRPGFVHGPSGGNLADHLQVVLVVNVNLVYLGSAGNLDTAFANGDFAVSQPPAFVPGHGIPNGLAAVLVGQVFGSCQ